MVEAGDALEGTVRLAAQIVQLRQAPTDPQRPHEHNWMGRGLHCIHDKKINILTKVGAVQTREPQPD